MQLLLTPVTTNQLFLCTHEDVIKWTPYLPYWPFVRETTCHWLIPLTKASDAELCCFVCSTPEKTVEQTIEMPVIWDAIALIMTSLWWKSGSGHRTLLSLVAPGIVATTAGSANDNNVGIVCGDLVFFHWPLWREFTGEFPSQRASAATNGSIFCDIIMQRFCCV